MYFLINSIKSLRIRRNDSFRSYDVDYVESEVFFFATGWKIYSRLERNIILISGPGVINMVKI